MRYLTDEQKPVVKRAILAGYFQHQIAAYYDLNQGRISEFKRSKQFSEIAPAPALPDDFPAH